VEAHTKLAGVRPAHNESRLEFVVQRVICQGDNISKLLPCVFLCAIDERELLAGSPAKLVVQMIPSNVEKPSDGL
jgi:hypothetical protein